MIFFNCPASNRGKVSLPAAWMLPKPFFPDLPRRPALPISYRLSSGSPAWQHTGPFGLCCCSIFPASFQLLAHSSPVPQQYYPFLGRPPCIFVPAAPALWDIRSPSLCSLLNSLFRGQFKWYLFWPNLPQPSFSVH